MTRALILACSERKVADVRRLQAIERYDGPAFRVLRKYLRESDDRSLDVMILSARYGLIPSDRRIPDYDVRLSAHDARQLQARVSLQIMAAAAGREWCSLGICVGKVYLALLEPFVENLNAPSIDVLKGGQGKRLSALKSWLRETRTTDIGNRTA